jgi:SAM-dependent methyltransferase
MPDAIFTDPRLAAVYPAFNPEDDDTEFYLDLAGASPLRVLDMGCGYGRLACGLAARGHAVTGADPATAMLQIAGSLPGAEKVTWIESDAGSLSLDARFDLIVMTGHVFQVFLEDEEIRAVLRNLARHLAPGGRLAFETRNPAAKRWLEWTPEKSREVADVEGVGPVEVTHEVTDVTWPFVTFQTHYRFPDGDRASAPSTLRFMEQKELAGHLRDAGFTEFIWYGYWDRSPLAPSSREIIVIAG